MRKDSGLTLLEMLMILAIIAILSAIALPNIIGWLDNYRLGGAAVRVLSAVEHGRSTAVKENASVSLSFNTADDNFTIWVDNGAGGGTQNDVWQNGTERTILNAQIPQNIDLTAAAFGANPRFRFNSRGLPFRTDGTPGGGTATLTNSRGDVRTIAIGIVGNCKIQ